MVVEIRLFASLRDYLPEKNSTSSKINIQEGASIQDMICLLNIPKHYPKIILKNAVHASLSDKLTEGDVVSLFPPIAGG